MCSAVTKSEIVDQLLRIKRTIEEKKRQTENGLPDLLHNCAVNPAIKGRRPKKGNVVLTSRMTITVNKEPSFLHRSIETDHQLEFIRRVGSVRGVRNGVSRAIDSLNLKKQWKQNYASQDKNKVVVYMSSLGVVRKTWERCRKVVMILENNQVEFERRDLYLNRAFVSQFKNHTGVCHIQLPKIYIDGQDIGDEAKLEHWNENGLLKRILKPYITKRPQQMCTQCYGFNFLPCVRCHGGKKSQMRYATLTFRCAYCDDSGIILCEKCSNCIIS